MIGISGEAIPLSARIMALSDVYDALRSKRPYKDAFSHEKAMDIIMEGRGKHFDPKLVYIFLENHSLFRNVYDQLSKEAF
jgi:putative two-component system response regulator